MKAARFDVVLFGATSFVGSIIAAYLARQGEPLRWALAGRSKDKLEALRSSLGAAGEGLECLVADAEDPEALRTLCRSTRVVLSCVGPYALYGSKLVEACVEQGTDYCDLTGEPQWVHLMIQRFGALAKTSGARIVHCCGFDSIPSDLGVWNLQQASQRYFGQACTSVSTRVTSMKGGVSGGTVASMLNVLKQALTDRQLRRVLADPYALCLDVEGLRKLDQHEVRLPEYDARIGQWCAPFVMASVNTKVVLRTYALLGQGWGAEFRYDEAMAMGGGLAGRARAMGMAGGLAAFVGASVLPPSRWLLQRFVLPAPGEGPSAKQQEQGSFEFEIHGTTADGQRAMTLVSGDRDPGYGSTAKMIAEAARCLALDLVGPRGRKTTAGGFWTPAALMGEFLTERLTRNAGVGFESTRIK